MTNEQNNDDRRYDAQILDSWHTNAEPWTSSVRRGQIESRRLITDRAVIDAVLSRKPGTVLDIGCGEGWLARALSRHGIRVTGLDAVPALIEQAKRAGGAEFRVASYEQITNGEIGSQADLVVCNFALFGRNSVEGLLRAVPGLLRANGTLVIQTLHPVIACGDLPYRDGWREGSWAGFDPAFTDPAPWYFRTLESWIRLLRWHGLRLLDMIEPLHPLSQRPASVIFLATL
ncbi:MAG TPA: class I SAM-dependent methyltransferase [Steroidobacteraceae bacterium]|jgi:2-polyprenyl-3-methyl-5-hydroxy-6-metoxy-1,4-benzoquinol methylase|nr:class I SAM-dependent methyltransferase [Steroidobacteraceae bacterium]